MSMWTIEDVTEILAQNELSLGAADPEMVVALANDAGEGSLVSEGRILGVWFETQPLDAALVSIGCDSIRGPWQGPMREDDQAVFDWLAECEPK